MFHVAGLHTGDNASRDASHSAAGQGHDGSSLGRRGEDHADGGSAQASGDEGDRNAYQDDPGADGDVFQGAVIGIIVFLKLGDDGGSVVAEREHILFPLKLFRKFL